MRSQNKPKSKSDLVKPRPFGHYFILEKIAQGGMAEVFKGLTYDFSGIKKFIVIKRILPHISANKEFINMLIAEAKIAVHLSHGNIAQVYDLGKVGNDYFIVMEYVDGKNLSQILKKCREKGNLLPIEFCIYFISELCNGLDYIHRRTDEIGNEFKIVHRDISPQNVIVSFSGNVKIVDFGVAKAAIKLGENESGILKGKFAYMSPEQADGIDIDHRSDLFSTGIVLWELLTGQRLFKKKTNTETVLAVKQMAVIPPSQYRPDIPVELDQIVLKMLNRKVSKRYESAQEIGLDLTKALLKYYPEFKPASINDFLAELFERDDEVTGDIHFEKTLREESTQVDFTKTLLDELTQTKLVEDTAIVKSGEIDFRSVFDEINWEDSSEERSSASAQSPFDKTYVNKQAIEDNSQELSITGVVAQSFVESHRTRNILKVVFLILSLLLLFAFIFFYLPTKGI